MPGEHWRRRLIGLAEYVATWSKDPSTKVGCVLADHKNRIISVGFNGMPRGVSDHWVADRQQKILGVIHAETNAILFAERSLEGATAYVTAPPCAKCAALLIQAGVRDVICRPAGPEFARRWAEDIELAQSFYRDAGVRYVEI